MPLQTREELTRRHDAYRRARPWVFGISVLPMLVVYVLLHTKVLRQYLPESRELSVLLLVGVPGLWLFGTTRLHRWLGPILHRLRCDECQRPLVDEAMKRTLESGHCAHCGAQVLADAGENLRDDSGAAAAPR